MADKEKFKGKPGSGGGSKTHPAMPIIILFVLAVLLGAIAIRVERFFETRGSLAIFLEQFWAFLNGQTSLSDAFGSAGGSFFVSLLFVLKILSIVFSITMIWLIFSNLRKLRRVDAEYRKDLTPPTDVEKAIRDAGAPEEFVNPKWQKVIEHINSSNPSDWKLAILEADIILDEMLDKMGYHGETIGEKLKMVEPSDFTTLNSAWEAHKVRNAIAHEGSDFLINKREADRVIRLFEEVFKEFKFI